LTRDTTHFLIGLKSLLAYHRTSGIDHYPRTDEIQNFLRFQPSPVVPHQPVVGGIIADHRKVAAAGKAPWPVSLGEIAEEVAVCRACDLHKQRLYPVAGRGPDKVRLLLVGDWLAGDEHGYLPPGQLFGVEQDLMLARMLAAIRIPLDEVFITNVIKCAVPASCQPQACHVQSCVSYLRRQIMVLAPEVVCTMGMVAARAVLEKSQSLSSLRGRIHEYEAAEEVRVPVITTYHPTYLLQNPEMKTATWTDLQFLAKFLDKKSS
jgi:uracil-DNA glycosylase family 4